MKNKLYYQFAASCCLLIFFFLGYVVKFYESWLSGFDQFFQNIIRNNMTDGKTNFFLWITKFANPITIILITAVFLLLLCQRKNFVAAGYLMINIALGAGLAVQLFKLLFMRERPSLAHLVEETSNSFPSGHASGSLFLYGTLIILLPIFIKNKKIRFAVQILLGIGILLVGISRIYLGVHYPTDIIGGYLLAGAWLLGTYPLYQKFNVEQAFRRL